MQSVSVHGFFNAAGSIRPFPCFFWGGEYVCPSYGPLKLLKLAKSGQKSVRPFVKNFGIRFYQKM